MIKAIDAPWQWWSEKATHTHSSVMFYPIAAGVSLCDDGSPSSGWGSGAAIPHRTELGGTARDLEVLHKQHLAGSSVGRTQAELPSAHPPAHACLGTHLLGCSAHSDSHFCLFLVAHGP